MKLSQIKSALKNLSTITFQLPNGDLVPRHFHVTEVGKVTKHFIDCGGTVRTKEVVNFQFVRFLSKSRGTFKGNGKHMCLVFP